MGAASDPCYESLRQRHLLDMRARVPAALARLDWPVERLAAYRQGRLRELVHFAATNSAWHRPRLAHLQASTLTERDLRDIPPMTKADVMEYFDELSTDARVTRDAAEAHLASLHTDAYFLDRYHVTASGGSSGHRSIIVTDWDGWAEGFAGLLRALARLQARDPVLRIAGRPLVGAVIAAEDPTHTSSAMPQTFSDPTSAVWHRLPVTLPLERIVERLGALQPLDMLIGYPSVLRRLALAADDGRLKIAPKLIVSTAEPLLPEARAAIESAWDARLLNWWASSETFGLAMSCGFGPGLHLYDDTLIIEPVDAAGLPVTAGEGAAKVYVTNLINFAPLPLIRYEITDEVVLLDAACPCGSAHRLIGDVQGRLDDSFDYGGGKVVHPHPFRSSLARERGVVEYQIRQTPRGAAIALCCNAGVQGDALRRRIIVQLEAAGLRQPEVTIQFVDAIERQRSGKLSRFVPMGPSGNCAAGAPPSALDNGVS